MSEMDSGKTNIVISLLRLGSFLHREGNRLLADFNLNQQQFIVLRQIQLQGPVCQKDICSQLLYEKSNISKIVKKSVDQNLIQKVDSPQDNRLSLLVATPKGDLVIKQGMARLNNWNNNWLKSLSKKEAVETANMLEKLSALY